MTMYKHWLKIDGYSLDEDKQYEEIQNYLNEYPESKAKIYQYDNNLFNKVVLLECNQSYNDLDMKVNSYFNNLRRLKRKPSHISKLGDFKVPEYL